MSLRKEPKQYRSKEMVNSILQGAMRVLAREDLKFSTREIAGQTGISVGSLYQYFKNREEILKELIYTFSKKQNEDILETFRAIPNSDLPEDYISNLLNAFYDYIFQDLYLTHNIETKAKQAGIYHLIEELDKQLVVNLYQELKPSIPQLTMEDFQVLVTLLKSLNNPLITKNLNKEKYINYSKKIVLSFL